MKRTLLGVFIACDVGLIVGSAYVLYTFIARNQPVRSSAFSGSASHSTFTPASNPAVSSSSAAAVSNALIVPAATGSSTRKILFTFRNPRAQKVLIRADFTGWKPELMQKGANGQWSYKAALTPGEYAYCYSVDNKDPQKDPANKRTKIIGKAVVSAIVVEALPSKVQ